MNKSLSVALIIIGFLMTIAGIMGLFYLEYNSPMVKKEVKCYDRYANEIIGLKCYEESIDYQPTVLYIFAGPIAFIGIFMCVYGAKSLGEQMREGYNIK